MIDTSIRDRSKMRFLRSDLIVTPTQNPPGCSVRDERNGEVYEFGAVENFLLSRLRRPYRTDDLSKECNAQFDLNYRSHDIEEFIEMLAGWQLLRDETNGARPTEDPAAIAPEEEEEIAAEAPSVGEESGPRRPGGWHLFNPEGLLDGLNILAVPLRFLVWLVPVVFALGTMAVMFHWTMFVADLLEARDYFNIVGRILLWMFTINLLAEILRGMVARYFGLSTPSFGLTRMLERPFFRVQVLPAGRPSRKVRLWLSGAPILLRIFLFGACALAWNMTRQSGSFMSTVAAELTVLSAFAILLNSNPLWLGDGPRFLSALLDIPDVQERSRHALLSFFVRQPAVIARYRKHRLLFGLLGLGTVTFIVAFVGWLAIKWFPYLEQNFRGTGVALFVLIVIYVTFGIRHITRARKKEKKGIAAVHETTNLKQGVRRPPTPPRRGPASGAQASADHNPQTDRSSENRRRWLKFGLLLIFLVCLFLPYTYHPSGEAEVFPAAKATLPAEMDGVVDRVFFKGGEWIEAGTTVGKLADYRQVKDLRTTEATLESKKFEIEQGKTTPSAEQVESGKAQVDSAKLTWDYAVTELSHQKPLFNTGGISVRDYENFKEDAETKRGKLIKAEADLAALKAQVNPNKIESLKAEVDGLKKEIVFYNEQLRRTAMISPISGEITTKDLDYLPGSYLKHGTTFAEVEDTRTVRIQIAVPESDIGEVKIGAKVSLRLWAYPNREFVAEVSAIQPASEETTAGKMITVTSQMENPEGILKSGLTGQAKISGEETIVAIAFTKAIVRFVRVELWSWLP